MVELNTGLGIVSKQAVVEGTHVERRCYLANAASGKVIGHLIPTWSVIPPTVVELTVHIRQTLASTELEWDQFISRSRPFS